MVSASRMVGPLAAVEFCFLWEELHYDRRQSRAHGTCTHTRSTDAAGRSLRDGNFAITRWTAGRRRRRCRDGAEAVASARSAPCGKRAYACARDHQPPDAQGPSAGRSSGGRDRRGPARGPATWRTPRRKLHGRKVQLLETSPVATGRRRPGSSRHVQIPIFHEPPPTPPPGAGPRAVWCSR